MSFPVTHVSLIRQIRSKDAETRARAHDALAAVYWAPIYTHVRLTHQQQPADAEDLTQGFFVEALRRDLFARFDPERARFRTYIRRCVDSFVLNALEAEQRLKRGGAAQFISIHATEIEDRLTSSGALTETDADAMFEREWVRGVIESALAKLRAQYASAGRRIHLALFQAYDLADSESERPTYAQLAAEYGIPTTQVTNWLAAARRDYRRIVLETIRDLSTSDEEFREEAGALLGRKVQ